MINYELFQLINNLARNSIILDSFMIFLSKYGIFLLLLFIFLTRDKKGIADGFLSLLFVSLIEFLIKNLFLINRPFVEHQVTLLIAKEPSSSFPSGHATRSFALETSTVLHQHNQIIGYVSFIIAFLIGFSRIYVGVHYPSDVLGGIVLGMLVSYGISKIKWERLLKKCQKIKMKT